MLDVLSYPMSALMWLWHELLGMALNPDGGLAWGLAVVLSVIVVRALLVVPAIKQMRTMRRMRELQPQISALRSRYGHDRLELNRRIQRLHQDHGVGLLGGCLPVLVQVPVFLGLYHVLTGFTPMEPSADPSNGVFAASQVRSFLHAQLFGAPMSAYVAMPSTALHALGASLSRGHIAAVEVPLLILAALATHLVARQSAGQPGPYPGAAEMLSQLTRWLFPLFPLVGGLFFPFPIAIALYWVTTNAWTLAQNQLLARRFAGPASSKVGLTPSAAARYPRRGAARQPRPTQRGRGSRRRR